MPNHSGTLRISARQLFWCPPERDLVASFKLLRPPGFGLMSRGEWWDLCPGPETPLQAGEWQTELPPDAVERIQEKTESADSLFEDKIDLLPSLVRARYKPTGEIYETVFEACYGSICDNLNSILIEWALIGIPPGEFDARERHHKEYLTAQAEERMKVCMEDLEPLHHEIFEKIRRFLASGHALRSLNHGVSIEDSRWGRT
jgi:hypothetical protein